MANLSEKCLTCQKSLKIPKWNWVASCPDSECNYEPQQDVGTLTVASIDLEKCEQHKQHKRRKQR